MLKHEWSLYKNITRSIKNKPTAPPFPTWNRNLQFCGGIITVSNYAWGIDSGEVVLAQKRFQACLATFGSQSTLGLLCWWTSVGGPNGPKKGPKKSAKGLILLAALRT
jgi:hypothetical protein